MTTLFWVLGTIAFIALAAVLAWLGGKDRRWLFVGIGIYVIVPLLFPMGLPTVKITGEVRALYDFVENLPTDIDLFNDFHAQIVKLGKDTCKKSKPLCEECPLNDLCPYPKHQDA